jgi:hypothetical protein
MVSVLVNDGALRSIASKGSIWNGICQQERPNLSAIRRSIAEASKEFLAAFHRDWAGETMSGFLLETSCERYMMD